MCRLRSAFCWMICLSTVYVRSQRAVTIIADWSIVNPLSAPNNAIILPGHAALHIAGDAQNGALRIQIGTYRGSPSLDVLDFGVGNDKDPIGMDATGGDPKAQFPVGRKLINVGQTALSNPDIFDEAHGGAGIATDVVSDPAGPFNGIYTEGIGGCMVFVQNMIGRLFPNQPNPLFDSWVEAYKSYILMSSGNRPHSEKLIVSSRKIQTWGNQGGNDVSEYTITGHNQLTPAGQAEPQGTNLLFQDDYTFQPVASPWDEQLPSEATTSDGHVIRSPFDTDDVCERSLGDSLRPRCGTSSGSSDAVLETDMALVRVNGVLSTIALVTEATAQAAGAAAAALAAAFVILDFVDGNWVGGAFGAAGLALGILAAASVAGPIGWILGGLVSALFAILPGLFSHRPNMPAVGNMTQIIQFKMFGDALHTGNEKCQEQNPQCQAVYGPGTLSSVFGWDYFDAIAFLIHFNSGFPITIPDMAAAFQVNGTAGAIAVMDCHNGRWTWFSRPGGVGGYEGDDPKFCNHPQFALDRNFMLPFVNDTAENVYNNRIIPTPGGDCKMIDAASNTQAFPEYNLTISGLPVSIACNLSANAGIPGASLDANAQASAGNGAASVSPAGASTNNQEGAYVAPPPAAPFGVAFDSSNSVCLSSSTSNFCLPNGTYDQPTGLFGYSMSGVNAVTIPPGCSFIMQIPRARADAKPIMSTITTSQPSTDTGFANEVQKLTSNNNAAGQFMVDIPATVPAPPAACFYSKTQYQGDVFCVGPGGSAFTGSEVNVAQSVSVWGGATVWIYAASYGDTGGQKLSASVPDLSSEPYGTSGSFLSKVVAAWVFGP